MRRKIQSLENIFCIIYLNTHPVIIEHTHHFPLRRSGSMAAEKFRSNIQEMEFSILPLPDTKSPEPFDLLIRYISVRLLPVIRREIREGDLLS